MSLRRSAIKVVNDWALYLLTYILMYVLIFLNLLNSILDSLFQDGFVNPITLNNHLKSKHSNERPHPCEYCPNKYATSMALSGHRSRGHGVNKAGEAVIKKL